MKRDRHGNPRGFAFIIYHEPAAVDKVMQQSNSHILNGRKIDPKRARAQSSHGAARPRKMFVRNSKACTENELRDYFSQYGAVSFFFKFINVKAKDMIGTTLTFFSSSENFKFTIVLLGFYFLDLGKFQWAIFLMLFRTIFCDLAQNNEFRATFE